MFTRFFIDRPIFASVLSIVTTLAGGLALVNLPIAMFPQIAPPTVSVTCQYPGASAQRPCHHKPGPPPHQASLLQVIVSARLPTEAE